MLVGEPEGTGFTHSCPGCGKQLDGHMVVDHEHARPSVGDVSVCMYCQTIMVYSGPKREPGGERPSATGVRKPTEAEMKIFERDPRLGPLVRQMREFMENVWTRKVYLERDDTSDFS